MNVRVNGTERELEDGSTVSNLVSELGYGNRQVVVELNGEPLERSRFAGVKLEAGDVIEVVRAVAGG